jgi:hypothetical protein
MVRQQELHIDRLIHPDRNAEKGGKSFYFFDLDENIFSIESAHYVFHKKSKEMLEVPGKTFWEEIDNIGKKGFLKDYEVLYEGDGSFRRFRDLPNVEMQQQPFFEDLKLALKGGIWMGPSWNQFHHAVHNQRPVALITARGHHPETIKSGLTLFKDNGILAVDPNYLAVLPVSHPDITAQLGGGTVPELKRKAIRFAVEQAFQTYGYNDHHRFGMSDDDPKNVQKIIDEFIALKKDFPKVAFFIIETTHGNFNKWEIYPDHAEKKRIEPALQLSFFE